MKGAALITGAAARIGRALALALAADGWAVAVHYNRSEARAKSVLDEMSGDGLPAVAVAANLAVPEELNDLVARAAYGLDMPITALINNASSFAPDRADNFTRAHFDHHMDINLYAALRLSQDFAAQFPRGGDQPGAIINIIDQRVLRPKSDFFTYSLSKAGLYWATQTLAQSLAPHIRVNAIGPGPSLASQHQNAAEFKKERAATLLGEGSPPDTIIDAVRYLLSARAVTGQMIAVDGGQHLYERP